MLLLLLACNGDCPDADCRQAEIMEQWEDDAAAATERIAAMADPIEKVAVITRLTETHPGQTMALCSQLSGDAATRCKRLNHRPHLRAVPPPPQINQRPAAGPQSPNILPSISEPFASAAALPALGCEDSGEPKSCRSQKSIEAAREGRARTAVSLCRGMPGDLVWKEECIFHAAEQLLASGSHARLADASAMCLSTGSFAANCLAHLTRRSSLDAPPASTPGRGPWTPILAAAEVLDGYWQPLDPQFAALAIDRLWADALSRSYARSAQIVGNPLDLLPAATRPHIHAAAALRMLGTAEDRTGALADWQARLDAALSQRVERPIPPSKVPLQASFTGLWPSDGPGEEDIPAAFGPGNTRRPISDDVATDRLLAILEAAARSLPPYTALLEEAKDSGDPLVQWNATRLLEGLEVASEIELR